jgi:ATP-binding cassette subfamily B protein
MTKPCTVSLTKLYKFFLKTLESKSRYFTLYCFSLLHPLSSPFSAVFTSLAVSFLAAGKFGDLTPLWFYIGGIALMDGTSIIVLRIYLSPMFHLYQKSYNNTVNRSLAHIKTLGLDWYSGMNGGDIIHRVTRGAEALRRIMMNIFDMLVHETIRMLITIAFTIYFLHDWAFLLGIIAYIIISYLVVRGYKDKIYDKHNNYRNVEGRAFTNIYNFASGFSTIKLANLADFFLNRTAKSLDEGPVVKKQLEDIIASREMYLRILQYALYICLFIYVGFDIIKGHAEVGTLVLVFNLLQNIGAWLQKYYYVESTYIEEKIYFESLFEIFTVKPKLSDKPGATEIDRNWEDIRFENVSFKYQNKQNFKAIDNLSLTIKRGSKVAFVGESGSGKSTLSKLILRQYGFDGRIFIGGRDIFSLKATSLYNTISYLPQDVEIFDLTFKENITLSLPDGRGAFSLEQIVQIAHLRDIIDRLPEGVNTPVGARGIKLSGGERQRLGIARALYLNKDIYIFDECTSQLDGITEYKIMNSLFDALKGKTIVMIAHRLYTLSFVEEIFVFEHGRICEHGTFDELTAKGGSYSRLLNFHTASSREKRAAS